MDIKELIGQHNKSVALVFKQLGINAPVTEREIIFATLVYQDIFINAIAEQLNAESYFDGNDLLRKIGAAPGGTAYPPNGTAFGQTQSLTPIVVSNKKNKWLQTAKEILSTVADSASKIISAKNSKGETVYVTQPSNTGKNADNNNKWLMYGGIALLVLLIIAVIVKNNK
jgi:hypothetical protein